MCVCMYVCVCMCVYGVCMCVCMCVYGVCMCVYVCVYVCVYGVCMCVCMGVCMCVCMVCVYVCVCTRMGQDSFFFKFLSDQGFCFCYFPIHAGRLDEHVITTMQLPWVDSASHESTVAASTSPHQFPLHSSRYHLF